MLEKFVMFLFILVSSFFPLFANAQGAEIVRTSTIPLVLNIESAKYLSDSRTIVIDYSVTNNSDSFVDGLKYNFSFYAGEQLEKEGLLFRNLDYAFSVSDEFGSLSPKESKKHKVQYTPPASIEGGNHFIKGTVFNDQFSFYGASYTKDPIMLTGRGGFLSNVNVNLFDPETNTSYRALEGPTLDKDKTYFILLPKSSNQDLFKLFEKGNAYADLRISHTNYPEDFVYKKEGISLKDVLSADGENLELEIKPWENIKSGPHTAYLDIVNAKGDSIAEKISVRLLYKGLFGRIYKTDTKINSYRLGEPIDLVANVTIAGDVNAEKANLKAVFKNGKGTEQEFTKEISLNKNLSGVDVDVDFSDQQSKKMLVEEIELTLSDAQGNILDSQIIKMNTEEKFSYPLGAKQITNIIITIISLILVLAIVAFVLKKTKVFKTLAVLAIVFLGSAFVYQSQIIVFAQGGEVEGNYADIWSVPDGEPGGLQENVCGTACIDSEFYVKLQCKTCNNQARSLDINYFNNWQSGDTLADGEYDRSGIANAEYLSSTIKGDTIDQFIYGPFNFPFCFENFDDVGNMLELEDPATGIYSQSYNVQVKTTFGGDYCQLDVAEGEQGSSSSSFTGVTNEIRTMSCKVPGTLKTSFFIDYNEDGTKTSDEPYLKSKVANVQCSGIVSGILGRVFSSVENVDFRSLRPKNCDDDFKPYFSKNRLSPGKYVPSIEPNNTLGWEQTGLQYFNNSTWQTVSEVPVVSRGVSYANIGVKNTDEVVISCAVGTDASGGTDGGDNGGGGGVITDPDDENPDEDPDPDDPPIPPGQGGDGGSFPGSGSGGGKVKGKDYCPGIPGINDLIPAAITIIDKNNLPIHQPLKSCYPNELGKDACGLDPTLDEGRGHNLLNVSLRLYDPCHPTKPWFIKTYFRHNEIANDSRIHGDAWDVTINKNVHNNDKIYVEGWMMDGRINGGKTRIISDSKTIVFPVCGCQCTDPRAINGQGN